jgi:23S rRNA (pseudouridine1915-N3)-methyltransferase
MRLEIIAVGRLKQGPYAELIEDYSKRMRWDLRIVEVEAKSKEPAATKREETEKLSRFIEGGAVLIALDERGKNFTSHDFAKKIEGFQSISQNHLQFFIGGADGLDEGLKARAALTLSLGAQTWPHMLARVMLVEQIYRAQQILAGHPYHRA